MKNIIFVIFTILYLTSVVFCAGNNQSFDWTYEIQQDGSAIITGYSGTDKDIIIPNFLDDHHVSSISYDVFWFNERITSIDIPSSLTLIEDYPYGDDSIWGSRIPDMLDPGVARLFIDEFATAAQEAQVNPFLGCLNLETITVSPENPVFEVSDGLLINKTENKTVAYPAGRSGSEYEIREGITSIGFQTFFGSHLTSVTLPASINSINQNPFIFCPELSEILVSAGNNLFEVRNHALINKDGKLLAYPGNADVGSYEIPEGVTSIGDGAFINNQHLSSVSIPGTAEEIGFRAFDYNFMLETVSLQEGIRTISSSAFKNCEKLKEINLPKSITYIADDVFMNIGRQLVFTVDKESYGALWAIANSYRFHYPDEPEEKSRLTKVYESLQDETGKISKLHLNYRAEHVVNGWWFTRDIYIDHGVTYVIDENDADGVEITLYKDGIRYNLNSEDKTGTSSKDEHWFLEMDGVLNQAKNFLNIIIGHVYRNDYVDVSRYLGEKAYRAEVFPEYRYGPEIAFYFDSDGNLVYCYEEKYYGLSPAGIGKGEILFTVNTLEKDFDESVFDISDYEITELPEQKPIIVSDIDEYLEMINSNK